MKNILITSRSQLNHNNIQLGTQIWLGPWISPDDFRKSREVRPSAHRQYAPRHGFTKGEYEFGVKLLATLYKRIILKFSERLNVIHDVNEPNRYWEILIGQWLYYSSITVLEKILHLEKISRHYKEFQLEHPALLGDDSIYRNETELDFIYRTTDQEWMGYIYSEIIDKHPGINITNVPFKIAKHEKYPDEIKNISSLPRRMIKKLISRSLQWLHKESKYFLYETNMAIRSELVSNIYLSQWPIKWAAPTLSCKNKYLNQKMRDQLLYENYNSDYEKIIVEIIYRQMPMTYLENYNEIKQNVQNNKYWPTNPKVIFTSVGFSGFEYFKIWTAEKVKEGAKYVVGQHGNNYGTMLDADDFPELSAPDVFVSWGWGRGKNVMKGKNFVTKSPGQRKWFKSNERPIILIVMKSHGDHYAIYGKSHDYIDQLHNIKSILNSIAAKTGDYDILIKRHNNKRGFDLYDEIEAHAESLGLNLLRDRGQKFSKIFSKNIYLVIFTYDSTGFFESLAYNRPTICVTCDISYRRSRFAQHDYKMLSDAGVMCLERDFAKFCREQLHSVAQWWASTQTQDAVLKFAKKYCDIPDDQAKSLAVFLKYIYENDLNKQFERNQINQI
jgi:putative transferase (TIGR04331 family)